MKAKDVFFVITDANYNLLDSAKTIQLAKCKYNQYPTAAKLFQVVDGDKIPVRYTGEKNGSK